MRDNPVLPVSDPPLAGESDSDGKGVDDRLFKGSAMTKRGAYAALSYMACAVMLVLFNKAALSSYEFPLFLYALRRRKIISFTAADSFSIDNASTVVPLKTLFHTLPLSISYLLYMLASMASVRGVNVPMYTTLRRTTVAFTMVIEYMLTVMLVLFNKAALSSYEFPCVNVITLFQMVSSSLFLYALRRRKIISFTAADSFSIDNASTVVPLKTLFHTLPLSISYLLYMLASMASVRGVNVPMYTTLRRTTVAFTMVIEYMLTGQSYTRSIIGSVGVIVLGAIFAGARDLSFDFYGYGVVFLANITTAVYLASIARTGKSSGLNSFGLMWCNGIICGPILMIWTFICGDLEKTINFPHLLSPGFMVVLLCSCVLAFFLNYSIFLNTTLNSALTQTICGNMKDLFTVGLGWMLFGGLPFDLMNVIGQLLGFFGSGLYAYYKIIGR